MKRKLSFARGVTIIELMTSVVILGILAAMAAPRFHQAFERTRFRSANRDIMSSLRLTRSMAITDKCQYGVSFDYIEQTVTIFKDSINPASYILDEADPVIRLDTLPDEIECLQTDFANSVVVFAPNGSAMFTGGGNITTKGYSTGTLLEYYFNILPSTGRISCYNTWEEWSENHGVD